MPALRLVDIRKSFGERLALDGATLTVAPGEVHALLGENGAGKSTLMNIVAGLYAPDGGTIEIDGKPVAFGGPRDALAGGVGMIHQHFKLVGPLTVAENLRLACGRLRRWRSLEEAAQALRETAGPLGFALDPAAVVDDLPVAAQQRLEIVKALVAGARLLIMDEPTAVLTDAEAEAVLDLARALAGGGRAVILITHKLRDVAGHADRVTVMRGGRTVLDGLPVAEAPAETLVEAMVGGAVPKPEWRATRPPGAVRLALAGVSRAATGHRMPLTDIAFEVRANEILGIAGVGGNGQSELLEILIGLAEPGGGRFAIDGRAVSEGPSGRRRAGLRFVPDDRFRLGLFGDLSVADNLALPRVAAGEGMSRRLRAGAPTAIAAYGIAGASADTPARLLSGGNAQKLMIARELEPPFAVLVAHSPTRGLDVRSVAAVRYRLIQAAWHGAAIVLLSEDLDEVFDLADRVAVLSRGRLSAARPTKEIDRAAVGRLMLGAGE